MNIFPDFRGVLVVDEEGRTEYNNTVDAEFFEVDFRKVKRTTVLQWYQNRTEEQSTVMNTVRNGTESLGVEDILTTESGKVVRQISYTYCIKNQGKIAGALELSNYDPKKDVIYPGPKDQGSEIMKIAKATEEDFVGISEHIKLIKNKIAKIKDLDASVFITGETGTGKETLSKVIHNIGNRKEKPFIYVDCGALPPQLIESILFGTEKGAFTDAETRRGLFEEANGGTLLLDELDSMPLFVQGKLLKAIEEKRIQRVGGRKSIDVDVRIIASCNTAVRDIINENKIRADLFFRLSAIQIELPPLRARLEDIPSLSEYFLKKLNSRYKRNVKGFAKDVLDKFSEYPWQGNVRELRNAIEGAFHTTKGEYIELDALAERFRQQNSEGAGLEIKWEEFKKSKKDLSSYIREFEDKEIANAMNLYEGDMNKVCKKLGMTKDALRKRLKKKD